MEFLPSHHVFLPLHVFLYPYILPSFPVQWINCPFFYSRPILLLFWILSPSAYLKDFTPSTLSCIISFLIYWIIPTNIQNAVLSLILKNKIKNSPLTSHSPHFSALLYIKSCLFLVFAFLLLPFFADSTLIRLLSSLLL